MTAKPDAGLDLSFRKTLLECYLSLATSPELSRWLEDIGQDAKGSVDDKRQRIRQHTQYVSMPRETFPQQTLRYLSPYTADHLAEICDNLQGTIRWETSTRSRHRDAGKPSGWSCPMRRYSWRQLGPIERRRERADGGPFRSRTR